jgi:glycosyltransferase involved in cell wall biosynthesis
MHGVANLPTTDGDVHRWLYLEMDFEPWKQAFRFFLDRKKREALNLQRFSALSQAWRPDLIFIWGMWNLPRSVAAMAEERFPGRVVYRFADYWPTLPSQYLMYWQKPGRTWFSRVPKTILGLLARVILSFDRQPVLKFEHAICVSAATRDALVAAGIPVSRARVIHTGMDSSRWLPKAAKPLWSAENGSLNLLYAGRMAAYKGLETAIEAVRLLVIEQRRQSIRLDLAGGGAPGYMAELRRKVARAGIQDNVSFLGVIPQESMPDLMHQHDVLLVPSTWEEPLARVVLEGMAAGLVVIGTPLGGTKEIIRHGENGLLVSPGNAEELAQSISELIGSTTMFRRIVENGRRTVTENFTVEKMMAQIETYLTEICDSSVSTQAGEVLQVQVP